MSAWSSRNLAAMLKEQRASPATVVAPEDKKTNGDVPKRPAVSVEPKKPELPAPAAAGVLAAVSTPTPETVPTPGPASEPEVMYTSIGPVSMPQALAKLVTPSEFRFAGSVEAPKPVATLQPAVTHQPAEAAPKPVAIAPPIPVAAAPAPTVTSSSDLQQHQWNLPQPVYNPPVNDYMPRYQGALPYGGELGSVPRFYSTERQYNAQPYHPTYHTPYYRSGYSSSAIQYDGYSDMYHSHYPGQGAPYMGSRLQARPPYYPPRNPSLQQHPAAQYN
ncbi:hypothetical protein conserved [Leishmania donovani]|uniref:Uncharacterized protein n=3 Tax=Leishmania donovani species complex TaxID=38574 RepID=A4HYZ9_LEIIN|nr:conserved hypothetical protein [Leishmania infantum JPCM5]TPP45420.1 hypothetical protein CGC20_31285 [Leishmania donovani]CAC9484871.1 hypothetical_protein_-_conserved [Leishmania infantum]CAJ1988457.1 hypothetical protein conserved [Leishmania donovani]CAM67540.1 conserved hypothetical protein [Leishmania infantum JPCM5]SUZ41444.1 hypothetical_protein_-_conserved [Leishmania infantum]|eukprot:XP_001465290.1 conserved hypothetical protein [Leishmania infantum JPCM5]